MKKQKLIIVDGNALLHRAFHALPPTLTTKSGQMVNAVYGFTSILLKVFKDLKPDYLVMTFDKAAPTFRHKEYVEYKAQRKKQPQELYDQLVWCKKIVEVFNIPIFEQEGFEADDLIGTIAKNVGRGEKSFAPTENVETIIVTGDLDTLQLVDDYTKVFTLKKGINDTIIYDEEAVKEKFGGLKPEQLIDYKGLRGDPSDNIPGVKGIGEKGAIDLLVNFTNIENLYKNIDSDKIKEAVRAKLKEHKDEAFLSKKLATIITDVPLDFDLEQAKVKIADKNKVVALFQELEFKSLMDKIPQELVVSGQSSLFDVKIKNVKSDEQTTTIKGSAKYHLVNSVEDCEALLKKLAKQKEVVIDTETTGLNPRKAKLVGIAFCFEEGEGYYLNVLNYDLLDQRLKDILQKPEIKKIAHNMKYDYSILKANGIEVGGIYFDTMIASYVLNPGTRAHGLDALSFSEFGHQKITTEEVLGEKIVKNSAYVPMDKVDPARLAQYACEDVDYTFRLYKKFVQEIKEHNLEELFYKIEMPLVQVLAEMELAGVKIDSDLLNKMSKQVESDLEKLDAKIYQQAGEEFNIDSPKQLKEILFDKLQISTAGLKKTKTGISTAADELEKMKDLHPIIEMISEHRELSKLNSTYLRALPELVSEKTGRVHTSFNQTITATGRLSSSDPNLQNIPIRTELGQKIRQAFVAEPGYKLIAADYSQIELRIIASLANDQKMLQAFIENKDIHSITAAAINNVSLEKVTKEMRYAAKEVNFGVIYGMGAYGLAMRTGIDRKVAKQFIDKYFEVYSEVKNYLENMKTFAKENGYVETFFGRRRYLPEINSQVVMVRNSAERMAVNMPIQGTAADLMKLAMVNVYELVKKYTGKVRLILQVHDELVLEVKEELAEKIAEEVKEIMENVHLRHSEQAKDKFKAPIKVEAAVGDNWGECK